MIGDPEPVHGLPGLLDVPAGLVASPAVGGDAGEPGVAVEAHLGEAVLGRRELEAALEPRGRAREIALAVVKQGESHAVGGRVLLRAQLQP